MSSGMGVPDERQTSPVRLELIIGTRPEAIKLAPVVLAAREVAALRVRVCLTAQHREMADQVLHVFGIQPDVDLDVMQPGQTLGALTARLMARLGEHFRQSRPAMIVVQGDTTTALCAALAAYYERIPVAHVEAGLRTWDKRAPFPEEINRQLISRLADLNFAPTAQARENLLRDQVAPESVSVVGNTVIDALLLARERVRTLEASDASPLETLDAGVRTAAKGTGRLVLVTGHRRENFGEGFDAICRAIRLLATRYPDVSFVYPVHLNPNVREPVFRILGSRPNVHLIPPLSYLPFVAMMDRATLILTDSGGIQEEAPSLGKPVLVMRDSTERPEGVAAGTARLVGADEDKIVSEVSRLLDDEAACASMSSPSNPYGDGRASGRILDACLGFLAKG